MKKPLAVFAVAVLAAAASAVAIAQDKVDNELNESTTIIHELTGPQSTAGIPDAVLKNAKCIAVIPKMLKGGFVVGAQHGAGVATCRTPSGRWSPPAPFDLSGASFGAQIGGEEMGYVMMIMNDQGMQALNSGHFKLGAGVNAAAGPVGRDADASAGVSAAILTYARAKGAYAGATLNGDELNQDHKATKELYGQEVAFNTILNGQVHMPEQGPARDFVHTINHAVERAAE
ncbi:MAG TPA: lipid-binding SYLF domain-containing protein [Acidobacteriaceae bacterium]|nr:lipid-binding SYLF domain-containing protein [Acidobacteriaceae bacterium]